MFVFIKFFGPAINSSNFKASKYEQKPLPRGCNSQYFAFGVIYFDLSLCLILGIMLLSTRHFLFYFCYLDWNTAWKLFKNGVISSPSFPVFGLNTGKYGREITPYLDTFHVVEIASFEIHFRNSIESKLTRKFTWE